MGYRCRWIATRAIERAEVLSQLGMSVSEELNEEVYDPDLYAVDVDGWFVVFADGWDHMNLVDVEKVRKLSQRGEVLFFYTDDSPMCAELTSYVDGRPAWSIVYSGTNGVGTPALTGSVPANANTLLSQLREAQDAEGDDADVDHIYELAAMVGDELVGFRHDQTLSSGEYLPILRLTSGA
jgi:hypothetical protein